MLKSLIKKRITRHSITWSKPTFFNAGGNATLVAGQHGQHSLFIQFWHTAAIGKRTPFMHKYSFLN